MSKLTVKTRVQRMAKKYATDVKSIKNLLPDVYIYRQTKDGAKQYNCQTGVDERVNFQYNKTYNKKWLCLENEIYLKPSIDFQAMFCKYDKTLKVAMLGVVKINTRLTGRTSPIYWEYDTNNYSIVYIPQEDKIHLYNQDGEIIQTNDYFHSLWISPVTTLHQWMKGARNIQSVKPFEENFQEFNDHQPLIGACGRILKWNLRYDIEDWSKQIISEYNKSQKVGKKQQLLDEISRVELSDINDYYYEVSETIDYRDETSYTKDLCVAELINDDWCVFRYAGRTKDNKLAETYRVYINSKRVIFVAKLSNLGKWILTVNQGRGHNCYFPKCVGFDKLDIFPVCKYISSIMKEIKDRDKLSYMIEIINHPIVEQLWKSGYKNVAQDLLCNCNVKANIKYKFGETNKKGKNFLQMLGVNKYQLSKMNEANCEYNTSKIFKIKKILNMSDISTISDENFDILFKSLESQNYYVKNVLLLAKETGNSNEKIFLLGQHLSKMDQGTSGLNPWSMAYDTFNLLQRMPSNIRPDVDIFKVKTMSELRRIHDDTTSYYNAIQDKIQAEKNKEKEEKMKKIDKKRKEWEYENDEYVIRLPKDLLEISKEGQIQHICIGGYCDRHANGTTNIMFLRKKSEEDKPFYAIEIHNNRIIQIHGFGNKWLGTNPEVVQFVIDWTKTMRFECNKNILLSAAQGYGSYSANMLNESNYIF